MKIKEIKRKFPWKGQWNFLVVIYSFSCIQFINKITEFMRTDRSRVWLRWVTLCEKILLFIILFTCNILNLFTLSFYSACSLSEIFKLLQFFHLYNERSSGIFILMIHFFFCSNLIYLMLDSFIAICNIKSVFICERKQFC